MSTLHAVPFYTVIVVYVFEPLVEDSHKRLVPLNTSIVVFRLDCLVLWFPMFVTVFYKRFRYIHVYQRWTQLPRSEGGSSCSNVKL